MSNLIPIEELETNFKDIYSKNGPIANNIANYVARPEQLKLANKIKDAIQKKQILLAEAGTGTGKTLAYLVPALLSSNIVVISTGTKNLQNQLYFRDLPLVLKSLDTPVKTVLLKGRSNYLCKYRLELALTDILLATSDDVINFKKIVKWSESTKDGDISTLDSISESNPIWRHVTSTADNCLGQDCAFINNCFVYKARSNVNNAKIIVVNHHLLLSNWRLSSENIDSSLLPNGVNLILDEAHQIAETASLYFGKQVSSRKIKDLIQDINLEYKNNAKDVKEFSNILVSIDRLLEQTQNFIATSSADNNTKKNKIENKGYYSYIFNQDIFKNNFLDIIDLLSSLRLLLEANSERSKGLKACYERVLEVEQDIAVFSNSIEIPNFIKWYEVYKSSFILKLSPISINKQFCDKLLETTRSCILTSATMTVANSFSLIEEELGLSKEINPELFKDQVQTIKIASPFDYKKQSLLYIPRSMPDPKHHEYYNAYLEKVLPVLKASKGRAFLLFTSFSAMYKIYNLIKTKEDLNFKLLIQGESSKSALTKSFIQHKNSVLLATASFWEGVDIKGSDLHCVVIDKLPFAPPNDPIVQAKINSLTKQGKNAFIELQCQQAALQLVQGAGRLIRSESDYGVLVLCDPRVTTMGYGELFLRSLPNMMKTRDIEKVTKFYEKFDIISD